MGGLQYFPALALGPIAEHVSMVAVNSFNMSSHRDSISPTQEARRTQSLFDATILAGAAKDAFLKLDPRKLIRNPVISSPKSSRPSYRCFFVRDLIAGNGVAFSGQIAAWLWFTVLFATFAEAVAEGRGKAQADTLRRTKSDLVAYKLSADGKSFTTIPAASLKVGDVVQVAAGELIPGDGESSKALPPSTKRDHR